MPGWSPEIANEFIRMAAAESRSFDQMQLQGLVYLGHGWCLALHGEPLTGDRPEAWEFGPEYRKLADALAPYGRDPVTREISNAEVFTNVGRLDNRPARADLEQFECDLIAEIYENYGSFEACQLSAVTCQGETPWKRVFADGAGRLRDISHSLIKAQFLELLQKSQEGHEP